MRARIVTELSFYLENKPGILARLATVLADAGVNIKGFQAYEGTLQSLVMMVIDRVDVAENILRGKIGVSLISRTDILEVDVPNRVGGLAGVSGLFGKHGVNIESIYSVDNNSPTSAAYIRVDDVEFAAKVLNEDDALHGNDRQQRSLDSTSPNPVSEKVTESEF